MTGAPQIAWRGLAVLVLLSSAASAQELPAPFELPWSDVAPAVDASAHVVRTAAIGAPDERIGRFDPRRASARRAGRARAVAALHRWADDLLARLRADPRAAQATHAAIDAHAAIEGTRPLADGAAVVVVTVPLAALREACSLEGAPWMP